MALTIILSCVGSTALFSFVQFMISRHDARNERNDELVAEVETIQKKLDRLEKDSCRTQLLVLMSDYPDEKAEIMKLGEHYFGTLHANWYMSSMFKRWLDRNGIALPEWFNEEGF